MVAFDNEIQVLVVGAGVGGLALAGFLREAGLDPVVVDARSDPVADAAGSDEVSGDVRELAPGAVALLARLGVAETVREVGTPVGSWSLLDPDGTTVERFDAGDAPGFVAVTSSRLRAALCGHLPEGTVRTGTTLRGIETASAGLTVEFGNGVREPFDAVAGADGVRSRTRDLLDAPERTVVGTTSRAVPVDPVTPLDGARETWLPGGTVVRVLPTDDGPRAVVSVLASDHDGRPDPTTLVDVISEVDWLRPEEGRSRSEDGPAVESADAGAVDDVRVETDCWAEGRVAVLGEAAHGRHRLAGLHPTLAVEDAAVLAEELVGRDDPVAARLADYAGRRRSRFRQLLSDADPAPWFVETDGSLSDRLRSVLSVRSASMARWFGDGPADQAAGSLPTL